jgi:hypothetical protein
MNAFPFAAATGFSPDNQAQQNAYRAAEDEGTVTVQCTVHRKISPIPIQ